MRCVRASRPDRALAPRPQRLTVRTESRADGSLAVRVTAHGFVRDLCLLAELCIEARCPDVGRLALASIREEDRAAILAPELLRLEGELHLQEGGPDAAERSEEFRFQADWKVTPSH